MHTILIIAHGSRNEAANREIEQLAEKLYAQAGKETERVAYAFLEIAEPLVARGIDDLVAEGVRDIRIFPYFLAGGTHVRNDIPRLMDEARSRHPDIQLTVLPYLGELSGIPGLILEMLEE